MRIIDVKYNEIRDQFIKMLDLVENQLDESFTIFINSDINKIRNIIRNEFKVDKYEYKINKNCEKFLIICNPVADDLRNIMIINNMVPALKRISDITVKNARFIKKYENTLPDNFITQIELPDMLFHIKFMFKTAKESYIENSTLKLKDVFNRDKEVNKINKHAKKII
jgi:phosphate transport system protein